jgi:hypothetical protein
MTSFGREKCSKNFSATDKQTPSERGRSSRRTGPASRPAVRRRALLATFSTRISADRSIAAGVFFGHMSLNREIAEQRVLLDFVPPHHRPPPAVVTVRLYYFRHAVFRRYPRNPAIR